MQLGKGHETLIDRAEKFVFCEDKTINWLLRTHLIVETVLDEIICVYLPGGSRLTDKGMLTFRQKVELVISFSVLSDQTVRGLRALNTLRNKCAHEPKTHLALNEMRALSVAMGKKKFAEIGKKYQGNEEGLLQFLLGNILGRMGAELNILRDRKEK